MALLTKDAERRIIDLLLSEGLADPNLVNTIRQQAEAENKPLLSELISRNIINDGMVARATAAILGVPYVELKNITIDQDTTLFHSVELSHEYAHGLLSANKIMPGTLVCYQELISILLEKIAAYHLSKIQPDIEYKQAQFRKTCTKDSSDTYRKETTFLQYNAEEIGKKTALVTNYYIDNAYSYIIGDIYSEKLLEFYKQDPKEISSRISRIIDRKETVTKVLRDLDVSLTNQDTIKTYQKSLHKL